MAPVGASRDCGARRHFRRGSVHGLDPGGEEPGVSGRLGEGVGTGRGAPGVYCLPGKAPYCSECSGRPQPGPGPLSVGVLGGVTGCLLITQEPLHPSGGYYGVLWLCVVFIKSPVVTSLSFLSLVLLISCTLFAATSSASMDIP